MRSVGFFTLERCVLYCSVAGLPFCFTAHADFLALRSVLLVAIARRPLTWWVFLYVAL